MQDVHALKVVVEDAHRQPVPYGPSGPNVDSVTNSSLRSEKNPIEKLRSLVTKPSSDETKEVNYLKLLENGTWAGIGALFLWEIYINSPLFDRAAPMAPIVY